MLRTNRRGRHSVAIVMVTGAVLMPVNLAGAQSSGDEFHWQGAVESGRTVIVRNLNGGVRVERGSGDNVVIDARKKWRRGDPSAVRIEALAMSNGDILACALWNEDARCDEDGYHNGSRRGRNDRSNDVSVEFVVLVPERVKLDMNTVNGDLRITGATAAVDAHTVNGSIDASSMGGPVRAETVNGSVRAEMGNSGTDDLSYSTVNGSITVIVPNPLSADLRMETVNGTIESDFPLTVSGRINPRHVRATVGEGGRRVSLKTVNGSIKLRQGGL